MEYDDDEKRDPSWSRSSTLVVSVESLKRISTYQSDTDHDTVKDDSGFEKQDLVVLLGSESGIKVVSMGIVMSGVRCVRYSFTLDRPRLSTVYRG